MPREINTPEFIRRRKKLRTYGTPAEAVLWKTLKNRQLNGLKFRRQYSVGRYILDFYCPSLHLAIELDGQSHIGKETYDEQRTLYLKAKEITVLRYENRIAFENPTQIIREVEEFMKSGVNPQYLGI
ncbi:MAG: endonuclease domain-containing protein [Mediterranea sp.]|jgi:very-short-patch-repair endonuclease|nr:endonuclease domain-containing protein [Mediterranea sp.]